MSAVLKPRHTLTPEVRQALERIAAEVGVEHELRQDVCDEIPLRRRGRRIKKQPKTAVLVEAMKRGFVKRGTYLALSTMLYKKSK